MKFPCADKGKTNSKELNKETKIEIPIWSPHSPIVRSFASEDKPSPLSSQKPGPYRPC